MNICTCVIGGPICGICLSTTKDPKTTGNGCKSCGGFWKDCPVCAKVKLRRNNAEAMRKFEQEMKTLQEKIKDVEKEKQLKLYEVKVWGHRDYMVDKVSVVTILAKNEDTAKDYTIAQVVNDPRGLDIEVSAREITGPFEAGFILTQQTEFKK